MRAIDRRLTAMLAIITTVLVGWVLSIGAGILQPLVVALLLATLLQPVVRGLARVHIPAPVTVIALVTLLFFGLARMGIQLQRSIADFVGGAQPAAAAVETPGRPTPVRTGPPARPGAEAEPTLTWNDVVNHIAERMQRSALPPQLVDFLIGAVRQIDMRKLAADLIGGGFNFSKSLLLVVIYMLFIFAEQAVFRRKLLWVAGERDSEAAEMLDTMTTGVQRYLGVKTVSSLLTGLLCYGVLRVLDIPNAELIGFMTFLLNYIPTFGSIIAGVLATATALAVAATLTVPILVAATYLAVNLVIGNFLEPKVLGRQLNLSPLVIIISVVVWAGLWGVVGTFLAVPLTAAMQIMLASSENTRPLAMMLSSGPPKEERRRLALRRAEEEEEDDDEGEHEDDDGARAGF